MVVSTIDFLNQNGIKRRLTVPYTPQQNGVAERKNQTLVEMARCMIIQSGLPSSFCAEAIRTANYIRNRCVTTSLSKKTPHEIWLRKIPDLSNLRIFGEAGHYLDKDPKKGKFDPTGIRCQFTGYDDEAKGYRVWVPSEQKVIIVNAVKFLGKMKFENKANDGVLTKSKDIVKEFASVDQNL